jgi:hypothetical protein
MIHTESQVTFSSVSADQSHIHFKAMTKEDTVPLTDSGDNSNSTQMMATCLFHRHVGYCETLPCTSLLNIPSNAAKEDHSPFWKIPRELREVIYKLVLCFSQKLTLAIENGQIWLGSQNLSRQNLFAITAVCRTTRRESMSLVCKHPNLKSGVERS